MPRWVIESYLARCHRPGFDAPGPGQPVSVADVERWLEPVLRLGVRSIICLLSAEQLTRFATITGGLPACYRGARLEAAFIEAEDAQVPPLTPAQLAEVWSAYERLPKPVLVHCSAGLHRTGAAVAYIQDRIEQDSNR